MDAVVDTQVAPAAPVVPQPEQVVEQPKETTITEHAKATRDPERRRREVDDARPEEREQIGQLTKRLREAEEASGIKRLPNESNRVYDLRMRAELAERLRDAAKPKEAAKVETRQPEPRPIPQVGDFTEKEPTLEQFKDEDDPATAYFKALARYEYKKDQHEAKKAEAETAGKAIEEHQRKWWADRSAEHSTRLETFMKGKPEIQAKLEAIGDRPLSPTMFAAIQIHPDSPKLMLALADNPDLHDKLFLLTKNDQLGDPTRNPLVGIVQRRLLTKAQTGQLPERSPSSQWKPPAPPPSPVRTQPTAIAKSEDDKDSDGSIMAHARKYHRRDDD